jgi:hypothetical protein
MRKRFSLATILSVLVSLHCFCQLQRLAILPQGNIKVSSYRPADLKTVCIDYFRDIPTVANTKSQPYNQVYTSENAVIKINGEPTNSSFQSLVQSDNPLLILQPRSHLSVNVSINPLHPQAYKIKSIELEFKSPSEIGNIREDRDVTQSKMIFQAWGTQISQEDYWKRAKCLDILAKNNKLSFEKNQLSGKMKKDCDQLFEHIDLGLFPEKAFKALVENNYFIIDDNADLTRESVEKSEQAYYYSLAINDTKSLNRYSTDIKKIKEKYEELRLSTSGTGTGDEVTEGMIVEVLNTGFKDKFYKQCRKLTDISKENKLIKDTIINGLRYVLMLAWKSKNFERYIKKNENPLPVFISDNEFFKYPLFLTTKYDIEQFCINNNLTSLNETQIQVRLMELLGLPPNSTNDMFVEFWVYENDVFRPSIDSSLKSTLLLAKLSADYIRKFAAFSKNSYEAGNLLNQYPFTGLGYTWDYNPSSVDHFGVSEFVLKESKTAFIRRKMSTEEYLKNLNQ